ncbi:MAG: hypothetical protein KatS3mg051_1173 [Anaerolineae bacterium]|nr:MAG: hypothetical protein KatS3mg051_1173 [Anaerolineae bacterium]
MNGFLRWLQNAIATIYRDYGLPMLLAMFVLVVVVAIIAAQTLGVRLGEFINGLLGLSP